MKPFNRIIYTLTMILVFLSLYYIFKVPNGQVEAGGIAQKIFYWHVSSAWVSFFAFFLAAAFGLSFLIHEKSQSAIRSYAAIETGFLFCTVVLVTGPIWAKPVWGVWWRWEPRLTTFLILWMTYAVLLIIRKSIIRKELRARVISIYAVLGFLNVPIVYASARFWKTSSQFHPVKIDLADSMKTALGISMIAMTSLFILLWQLRIRILKLEDT